MGYVTSTSISPAASAPAINRPNVVAVGTIVWLGTEVMFFAGLFAIYFTLKSTSPDLWAAETQHLNVPYAPTNTLILVLELVHLPVRRLRRGAPAAALARAGAQFALGHGRVVHPHLPHGRDLRLRPGPRVRDARLRGHLAQLQRLRLGVLPDDRLPRPARHRRPHRLPPRHRPRLRGQDLRPQGGDQRHRRLLLLALRRRRVDRTVPVIYVIR